MVLSLLLIPSEELQRYHTGIIHWSTGEDCKLENAHPSKEQKGSQIGKVHLKLSCQPKTPWHIQLRFHSVIAKHRPCWCASALRWRARQLHSDSAALTTCSQNEIFSISSELLIITEHFKSVSLCARSSQQKHGCIDCWKTQRDARSVSECSYPPWFMINLQDNKILYRCSRCRPNSSRNMSNIYTGLPLQITNSVSFMLWTSLYIKSTCSTDCLGKSPLNMTSVSSTVSFFQVFGIHLSGPGAIFQRSGFHCFSLCHFFRWGLWQKPAFLFWYQGNCNLPQQWRNCLI